MVLLFSSSCNQSTMPVIFLTSTDDGRDGADDDGGNTADANNEDDQYANRENVAVSPTILNPGNDGRMFYLRRIQVLYSTGGLQQLHEREAPAMYRFVTF